MQILTLLSLFLSTAMVIAVPTPDTGAKVDVERRQKCEGFASPLRNCEGLNPANWVHSLKYISTSYRYKYTTFSGFYGLSWL